MHQGFAYKHEVPVHMHQGFVHVHGVSAQMIFNQKTEENNGSPVPGNPTQHPENLNTFIHFSIYQNKRYHIPNSMSRKKIIFFISNYFFEIMNGRNGKIVGK
jgi:hypothetical protein